MGGNRLNRYEETMTLKEMLELKSELNSNKEKLTSELEVAIGIRSKARLSQIIDKIDGELFWLDSSIRSAESHNEIKIATICIRINTKEIGRRKAMKMMRNIYEMREQKGLDPWTHTYDYRFKYSPIYIAINSFTVGGFYGANAGQLIFETEEHHVISRCHIDVINIDTGEGRFIPLYSDSFSNSIVSTIMSMKLP